MAPAIHAPAPAAAGVGGTRGHNRAPPGASAPATRPPNPPPARAWGGGCRRARLPWRTPARPRRPVAAAGGGELDIEFEIKKARSSGKLDLTECGLTSIPEEVLELTELRELSLVGNRIAALPEDIGRLANLERLGLAGNLLTGLPEGISELGELQGLWLHGNFLEELPATFTRMASLRTCALSGNALRELPEGLGNLAALEHLSASGNRLGRVPPSLGRLAGLRHLALNGNLLEEVPPEIGGLRMLQELHLQGNRLRELPGEWTRLRFLKDFSVADNRLEALPLPDPDSLISLITLYVYGNRLEELPPGLARLPSLQYLWAEGNPLRPDALGPVVRALAPKLRAVGLDAGQAAGLDPGDAAAAGGVLKVAECWAAGAEGGGAAPGYFKLERADGAAGGAAGVAPSTPASPLLVVAFGSAPGVPNWGGLLKRLRAENPGLAGHFDLLYVADPARGWYDGAEQGGDDSYEARLRAAAGRYERVLMLGDSMGATAALLFAPLATRVVSFCPQVDLSTASIRPAKGDEWYAALRERLVGGVAAGPAEVDVHTGDWAHDVTQAGLLQPLGGERVRLTVHPIDGHRVALALDKEGGLMPVVRDAIADELRAAGLEAGEGGAPAREGTFRAANFL